MQVELMTGLSSAFKIRGLPWGVSLILMRLFETFRNSFAHRTGQEPPTDIGQLPNSCKWCRLETGCRDKCSALDLAAPF